MQCETMKRVIKARTTLVLDHPFFGALALRQEMIIDETCPTAATNSKYIKWGPKFVATLKDEELLFVMAHEVMHTVLDHPFRKQGRNHKKWNIAGDYVINYLLVEEKLGKMPKIGLLSKEIYEAGKGTTDGVYNVLEDEEEENGGGQGSGQGQGREPLDDCEDGGETPAEIAAAEAETKVAVAQAAAAAKMAGKLSANLAELVKELLEPKVRWEEVLRNFVVKAKRDDRTYARPSRRFAAMGMYCPSKDGERMGRLLLAIDRSGSQLRELAQFATEMNAIHKDLQPEAIDVVYFDTEICNHETFGPDDDVVLHPRGGGGTRFSPIFAFGETMDETPVCCVVLTDLESNDFGPAPSFPVLWVTTNLTTAPFGEVVKMK